MNENNVHLVREHLIKGDPYVIINVLHDLELEYYYDSGDYYISENDYHLHKNELAYWGIV